jgi:hypothetical protein
VIDNLGGIASLISALAAIGAVVMSARNARKIQEVHVSINSRFDQWLKERGDTAKAAGLVEGNAAGLAQGRSETAEQQSKA